MIKAEYSILRFAKSQDGTSHLVTGFYQHNHAYTMGIVEMVWGKIPDTLEAGGEVGETWKLSIGEGHWLVVERTR